MGSYEAILSGSKSFGIQLFFSHLVYIRFGAYLKKCLRTMPAYCCFLDLWIKKKLEKKNLIWSFIIRIVAGILVWILKENARESYSKLEGIERSKLTDFLMSQIICKSNNSSKFEAMWSQRNGYFNELLFSSSLAWYSRSHLLLQREAMSLWQLIAELILEIYCLYHYIIVSMALRIITKTSEQWLKLIITGDLIALIWR